MSSDVIADDGFVVVRRARRVALHQATARGVALRRALTSAAAFVDAFERTSLAQLGAEKNVAGVRWTVVAASRPTIQGNVCLFVCLFVCL